MSTGKNKNEDDNFKMHEGTFIVAFRKDGMTFAEAVETPESLDYKELALFLSDIDSLFEKYKRGVMLHTKFGPLKDNQDIPEEYKDWFENFIKEYREYEYGER